MVSCKEEKPFIVIGHRGAMGHIMENTLPSVQKALDLKVDWIEIDVFVCKTGELVVFHDEILDSLSTSSGKIEDLTLAEIKKVELNGGYSIPTLKEVIELINQKVPLNIELKGKNTAKPTFELLNQYYKNGYLTRYSHLKNKATDFSN
jgi:glycerophosphoryl diester phosphodiesterase